jgi:AcrR family transcriptional regulator
VTTAASSDRAPARGRPGRPPTGARERILAACIEVLKEEGYAGLTVAKVAARAGANKALVAYHFGSKQGVVSAAARELGETITADVLRGVEGARTVHDIVTGTIDAVWGLLERDERLPRAYFDLNAVSVVDDEVRGALRQIKGRWREVLGELFREAGVPAARTGAATVLVIAAVEGFCLEWIERGDTAELNAAREFFADSVVNALSGT